MEIPWEWNKTPTWDWEWEGVGMNVDGNWNDPYSHGGKFSRIFTAVDLH